MRRYIRPTILVLVTLIIASSGCFAPALWDQGSVKSLSGIFALILMLLFAFFRQLNNITGVGVLNAREMERYNLQRANIRQRFWRALAVTTISCALLWLASVYVEDQRFNIVYTTIIGFLFALNVSYAIAIARWLEDLAVFNDKLRAREQKIKEDEATFKRLSEARKSSNS